MSSLRIAVGVYARFSLLVEQEVDRALAVSGRAYLLGEGRIVTSGPAVELRDSPDVQRTRPVTAAR